MQDHTNNVSYEIFQLKVSFFSIRNFVYLIRDKSSQQIAVIDPAWNMELLMLMLRRLGGRPDMLLLTHSHYDHVNLVQPLVKIFGSQVYMSAREVEFYGFKSDNLHLLQNSDVIQLGETQIRCLLTPGHTAGGACFLLAESIFTGDTVFIEGCGLCSGRGGSPDQMFESIQRLRKLVEPYVRVYPGHSYGKEPGYPLSYLLENNIYFQITKKEHFIQFRMRPNQKSPFRFY